MPFLTQQSKISGKISWMGVVVLTKPATKKRTLKGFVFNAFGSLDWVAKDSPKKNDCFISISAFSDLAEKMAEFPKRTALLVFGVMEKDDWWSDRNGKDTYKINAQFIAPQMDYSGNDLPEVDESLPEQDGKDFECTL
jgi:single-stranded DNA-binding protein